MIKMKKIPMRTCVVSLEKLPKKEMLRIVKNNLGEVMVDITGKANGRGIYIKKDLAILKKAKENKIFEKHLECLIDDSIYKQIENIINNK